MAQISRPWASTSPGDSGPYSNLDWTQLYQSIIGVGASRANVGVLLGSGVQPTDPLRVQAKSVPTTSIDVLAGSALVQGVLYISSATESFVIAANSSGNPRIDTVVLQADYALQTVRLAVLPGTPAASPSAPSLTQSANVLWEIPLADVAVADSFVSITNANITQRQEPANAADGVYLDSILNNSGGTLVTGDVVIWDTTADRAVTTTTTADDPKTAGVWVGNTANAGYGRVQVSGIGLVKGSAAITRGNLLTSSATVKSAVQNTLGVLYVSIGRALETTSGAGPVLALIDIHRIPSRDFVLVQDQQANGGNAASIASGAWRTRVLNTEVVDTAGIASLASNQITLQPGKYEVWATAANAVGSSNGRLRLRDTTGGATLVQGSNAGQANAAGFGGGALILYGYFTITVASALELQHWTTTTGVGGNHVTTGEVEVYANVMLHRIGELAA